MGLCVDAGSVSHWRGLSTRRGGREGSGIRGPGALVPAGLQGLGVPWVALPGSSSRDRVGVRSAAPRAAPWVRPAGSPLPVASVGGDPARCCGAGMLRGLLYLGALLLKTACGGGCPCVGGSLATSLASTCWVPVAPLPH